MKPNKVSRKVKKASLKNSTLGRGVLFALMAGPLGVAGLATTLVVQPGGAFDETELRLPSEVPGGRRFHRWGRSNAGGIQASSKRATLIRSAAAEETAVNFSAISAAPSIGR